MRAMSSLLGFLLTLLAVLPPLAWSRSFPSTPDATEAEQQRWGSSVAGYITEGCWWRPPTSGTTVQVEPCTAFGVESGAAPALKGFGESSSRALTFTGGDGRYWVAGRTSPGVTAAGWTCLDGVHYCWMKSETRPAVPSGLVLLSTTTVTSGLVGGAVLMAPLRRSTPLTVPQGVTLTLGACPEVERRHLFVADGVSSGAVRFAPGACGAAYPEWWGIDPSGVTDSTALWPAALAAVSSQAAGHGLVPLLCRGTYRISSTGTPALTLPEGTQLLGSYRQAGGGDPEMPCRFNYVGNDKAIAIPSGDRLRLEHLQVFDVNDTGTYGIAADSFTAAEMRNVFIRRFGVGLLLGPGVYYSHLEQVRVYNSRLIGVDLAGGINETFVDLQINTAASAATNTTLTHGLRVGQTPGLYSRSNHLWLSALVEVHRGIPISLARITSLDARLYVEHAAGQVGDFSVVGAIQLAQIQGGRVHLRADGNAQGGRPPVGLRIVGALDDVANIHTRNLIMTGDIVNYVTPYVTVLETGGWGLDLTGLSVEDPYNSTDASFSAGIRLGKSYLTFGSAPGVDQGRGSTVEGTNWQVGDLIFAAPDADGRIASVLRQVTVAGNPPTVKEVAFVTHGTISFASDDATPTVRQGNTYLTRVEIAGGAGATAITDIDDERDGQCLWARATGDRTIVDNANFVFKTPGDKVLTANATLQLCNDAGIWYEY